MLVGFVFVGVVNDCDYLLLFCFIFIVDILVVVAFIVDVMMSCHLEHENCALGTDKPKENKTRTNQKRKKTHTFATYKMCICMCAI